MGPGGNKSGLPKWDAAKRQMIAVGVTPVTLSWPPGAGIGFMGMGESWTHEQGK